jgi:methionyl aminopeptidase
LVSATEEALARAIAVCGPGEDLIRVGEAIDETANKNGFSVNHEFMGHGVGFILHMSPLVPHYNHQQSFKLQKGMIFTIEPILMEGKRAIDIWDDGWTAVSTDGGRAAQFEHEVLITDHGAEVLTIP